MARTNRPTTLDPDAWKKKAQEIQARIAKKDAERKNRKITPGPVKNAQGITIGTSGLNEKVMDQWYSDLVARTDATKRGIDVRSKAPYAGLNEKDQLAWVSYLAKKDPKLAEQTYNGTYLKIAADQKKRADAAASKKAAEARGMTEAEEIESDWQESLDYIHNGPESKFLPQLYEAQKAKDDFDMKRFKNREFFNTKEANEKSFQEHLKVDNEEERNEEIRSAEETLKGVVDSHSSRRDKIINEALKYGYKGSLDGKLSKQLDAAYNKAFEKYGDSEKAYDEIENNLYKNANKKFMAQRGAQMTADQKAREDAIRNNPKAAERRANLSRQWGRDSQKMSYAQAKARAKWDANRNFNSYGSRNQLGNRMQAYNNSGAHAQDTIGILGDEGWNESQIRDMVPAFSASDNYIKQLDFNQQARKATMDMAKAQTNAYNAQAAYWTNAVQKVQSSQKPSESLVGAVGETKLPTGAENPGNV